MIPAGHNMNDLYREAQYRWLRPAEVVYILQNHEIGQLHSEPPQVPPSSGSLILFNKRVTRNFRFDGHNWRKKRGQMSVVEGHEKLKVGNVEVLNCYYAHGEGRRNFQRRSYWMLDPSQDHIVLVHYRDINAVLQGNSIPGPIAPSPMLNSSASTTFYPIQNQCSTSRMTSVNSSYQNHFSPGSVEVSSEVVYSNNASDDLQGVQGEEPFSFQNDLQKLEALLSLDDDIIKTNDFFIGKDVVSSSSAGYSVFELEMANQQQPFPDYPVYSASYEIPPENTGKKDNFINHAVFQGIDENGATVGEEDSLSKEMLESWVKPLSSSTDSMPQGKQGLEWSKTINHQVENFEIPVYPFEAETESDTEYYQLYNQFMAPEAPNLTISEAQKYTIQDISPEWAYSSEATKVIIVGSFLCNASVSSWMCMFGEVEVPVEMIKDGVLCCEAPPCSPGRVTLCITTGNRESCSEVREFEYRAKSVDVCARCKSASSEAHWSTEELQVLVRTVRLLLCDLPMPQEDSETFHQRKHSQVDSESLNHILKALKEGTASSSQTTSLLLNELLKDKLHQWLSNRAKEAGDQNGCSLSKEEQGIIHLVAALGFEWALKLILDCGININFRDIYGRAPLHWAALFGREKMVAALIACGAYAGAVTDPSKDDPTGKTAASIAASNGFKGLAGYLSEVALTTHLSTLTLQECEVSRVSAQLEAQQTIRSVSGDRLVCSYEDQLSLTDSLAAVRSAALAAARIQSAFRMHSFRKRRQRECGFDDDYGINASDMQAISSIASSSRDCNRSALSIQKKYRGYKDRKNFLALRQKVVKIQAHVRGYQARKNYKVFCWAVGVLDRVVLRWRRRGVGLRNFLKERESKEDSDSEEEEDIQKLFRKQNMDRALDEAVSQVLSVVESPDARQQYRRLLESYRKTKAEGGDSTNME